MRRNEDYFWWFITKISLDDRHKSITKLKYSLNNKINQNL